MYTQRTLSMTRPIDQDRPQKKKKKVKISLAALKNHTNVIDHRVTRNNCV